MLIIYATSGYYHANLRTRNIFHSHEHTLSSSKEKKVEVINEQQCIAMESNDMTVTFIFHWVICRQSPIYSPLVRLVFRKVCIKFCSRATFSSQKKKHKILISHMDYFGKLVTMKDWPPSHIMNGFDKIYAPKKTTKKRNNNNKIGYNRFRSCNRNVPRTENNFIV